MGRRQRRTFLEGIDTLNRQDALMRSSFGLVPSDSVVNPQIAIFISHPLVFQDQFNVYDVGPTAEYLEDGDRTKWSEMFAGYEVIVIAIEYQDGNFALNHRDLMFELELFCEAPGVRFLHIDIAHTHTPDVGKIMQTHKCHTSQIVGLDSLRTVKIFTIL